MAGKGKRKREGTAAGDDAEAETPASPELAAALARLRTLEGAALEEELAAAEKQWRRDPVAASRVRAYRTAFDYDRNGGAVDVQGGGPNQALAELQELQNALRFDVARAVASAYCERFPGAGTLARAHVLLMGPGDNRTRWRDDRTRDVQVIAKPGARTTLFLFSGFRHNLGISNTLLYNVWLAPLDANVVFLRDWKRVIYFGGVESLGPLDQTIDGLKRVAGDLGSDRVVTMGNSGGAGAAMRFGVHLDANRVLSFAPATDLEFALSHIWGGTRARLMAIHKELGGWPHIRALLAAAPQVHCDVYFGADNKIDRHHAAVLEGIPSVALYGVENVTSHGVVPALAEQKRLAQVFASVLETAAAPQGTARPDDVSAVLSAGHEAFPDHVPPAARGQRRNDRTRKRPDNAPAAQAPTELDGL